MGLSTWVSQTEGAGTDVKFLSSRGDYRHASLGILDLVTEDLGVGGAGEHPIASVEERKLSKFCTISEGVCDPIPWTHRGDVRQETALHFCLSTPLHSTRAFLGTFVMI